MYTSTCGGRTEDFANVFDSAPVPYLRSVACTAENSGGTNGSDFAVEGSHDLDQTLFAEDGSVLNRNLELAQLLGITGRATISARELIQPAGAGEARQWITQAASIAGRETSEDTEWQEPVLRADFARAAAERLLGSAEIQRRITPGDAEYYLSNLRDGTEVPAPARGAVALLLQGGYWHTYPDNSIRPREAIRRADAISLLFLLVESAQPGLLRYGLFAAPGAADDPGTEKSISLKWGSKVDQFSLAPELRLFRLAGGRSTPADSLRIIGNEKLRFHLAPDGRIDFMEVELNPTGASSDRYSPVASWKVTLTRVAVADKLRPLTGNIGEFRDLKASRLGASGRAVQVQVVGSRRSVLLNGYKVRNALNLRDTLYTIRRAHNPSGAVESFTFDGRGWGHGIGLCQVGAYGMARAGRSYEEILKTYYLGVELRKAY
jgi:stage II sporulation protein D